MFDPYIGCIVRKLVFRVSVQIKLKLDCSATKTCLQNLDGASNYYHTLPRKLIRLHRCSGWYASVVEVQHKSMKNYAVGKKSKETRGPDGPEALT